MARSHRVSVLTIIYVAVAAACTTGVERPDPAVVATKVPRPAEGEPPDAFALRFIVAHEALGNEFDPVAVEFYSDEAEVSSDRIYPDGTTRNMTLSGAEWKSMAYSMWKVMEAQGDRDIYRECSAVDDGGMVAVSCTRFSERKKYSAPVTFRIGPDSTGEVRILAAHFVTRP